MNIRKIGAQFVDSIVKPFTKKGAKAITGTAQDVVDNGGKKLTDSLDSLATNAMVSNNVKITAKADTDTPEFKLIKKLVNGEVVEEQAKNAQYSAEIFNAEAALELATGKKSGKKAALSGHCFERLGKSPIEKALDEAERKQELIKKIGPDKWAKLQAQKAQQALKAQLLAKHGSKLK